MLDELVWLATLGFDCDLDWRVTFVVVVTFDLVEGMAHHLWQLQQVVDLRSLCWGLELVLLVVTDQ